MFSRQELIRYFVIVKCQCCHHAFTDCCNLRNADKIRYLQSFYHSANRYARKPAPGPEEYSRLTCYDGECEEDLQGDEERVLHVCGAERVGRAVRCVARRPGAGLGLRRTLGPRLAEFDRGGVRSALIAVLSQSTHLLAVKTNHFNWLNRLQMNYEAAAVFLFVFVGLYGVKFLPGNKIHIQC